MKQYQIIYIQLEDYKYIETFTNNVSVAKDLCKQYMEFAINTNKSFALTLLDMVNNVTLASRKVIIQ